MYGEPGDANYSGYFSEDTFTRIDMLANPSGWIKNNDPFPLFGSILKPTYSGLLQHQYTPIKVYIGTERTDTQDIIKGRDITRYKENRIPILDRNLVNNIQALEYYFDGKDIITNYNFSDEKDQGSTYVEYEYTVDKIKVAAKLYTNQKGQSEYTPILDNYLIKISTQRINR